MITFCVIWIPIVAIVKILKAEGNLVQVRAKNPTVIASNLNFFGVIRTICAFFSSTSSSLTCFSTGFLDQNTISGSCIKVTSTLPCFDEKIKSNFLWVHAHSIQERFFISSVAIPALLNSLKNFYCFLSPYNFLEFCLPLLTEVSNRSEIFFSWWAFPNSCVGHNFPCSLTSMSGTQPTPKIFGTILNNFGDLPFVELQCTSRAIILPNFKSSLDYSKAWNLLVLFGSELSAAAGLQQTGAPTWNVTEENDTATLWIPRRKESTRFPLCLLLYTRSNVYDVYNGCLDDFFSTYVGFVFLYSKGTMQKKRGKKKRQVNTPAL